MLRPSRGDAVSHRCLCEPGWTAMDCSETAASVTAIAVTGSRGGSTGAAFSKSGFASSSIVILAIATFVVGLCAIPVVKCFIDRRKRERSLDVIQGSNAEDHKHLLKFLDKQLAIGRS